MKNSTKLSLKKSIITRFNSETPKSNLQSKTYSFDDTSMTFGF